MVDDPVSPPASDVNVSPVVEPPIQTEPTSDLSASASESANTQPVQDQPVAPPSQPTEPAEAPPAPEPAQAPETPSVEPVSMSTSPQTEPPIITPSAQVVPPEVAPVTEETQTVQPIVEPQASPAPEPIPSLHYPYYMSYPVTFDFGAQPTDDDMKKKYDAWGIVGHNGLDFGLPEGTEVLACDEGVITQVGDNGDFGISITIKHSWGTSIYCHLQSFGVLVNDHVTKAQVIGLSDHTGYAIGPHLHFGIQPNNPDANNGYLGYINPTPYLSETSASACGSII